MNNFARNKILSKIRHALQREVLSLERIHQLQTQMANHSRGILPALSYPVLDLFIDKVRASGATVEHLTSLSDLPEKMASFFQSEPSEKRTLILSSDPYLQNLSWNHYPEFIVDSSLTCLKMDNACSLTTCFCGVAETGTLVMLSHPTHPTSLNFLPKIHFVLLDIDKIVSHYEDAWDLIRETGRSSRIVNFITGPSRSSDIEQTMQIGIHGPEKLHIFLYKKEK